MLELTSFSRQLSNTKMPRKATFLALARTGITGDNLEIVGETLSVIPMHIGKHNDATCFSGR